MAAKRDTAIFAKVWRDGIFPADHQYDMSLRVDDRSIQFQADFWPRDHGKSEIFCMAYPLRRICEDPNIRILLVQKTKGEAEKTLAVIKSELESNAKLKAFYRSHWLKAANVPDISNAMGMFEREGEKVNAWRQDRIYVKRTRRGKDPTVEAVGVGGAITGGHFDVIILDDVEDDENVRTETRRKWMLNWFSGTVMQLREPHTKMIVVGTLKTSAMDIYRSVRENPIWDCKVISSLLSHRLEDIEYEPVTNARGRVVDVRVLTPDVVTLWPERWHIRALLMDMYASLVRSIWIREKTNDLTAVQGKIVKREWFRYASSDERPAAFETIIQIWDTAWEEGETNDYSACVTLGLYKGRVYVLDVFRKKMITPDLKDQIIAQHKRWRPDRILIEDKSSGKAVIQMLMVETGLPIVKVSPGGRDKVARAQGVTVYFETGRVFFPVSAEWLAAFEDEVVLFPEAEHDDQMDALVYGLLELFLGMDAATVAVGGLGAYMEQAAQKDPAEMALLGRVQAEMAGVQVSPVYEALMDMKRELAPKGQKPQQKAQSAGEYVQLSYVGPGRHHFPLTIGGVDQFIASGWARTVERKEAGRICEDYPGLFQVAR